ncbi:MAG: sugar transferase [Campylobacterales bacterium]|nr:sugar transferase [Campylobacterales bacterium]
MYQHIFKPLLDRSLSLILLIVFSPLIILSALAVKISIGSPIVFAQKRPGKDEKIFTIFKFRTMTNETDENGELLPDEKRLTKAGKIIRSLSLDELPQLLNVLKGEMSFIGPRPLLVEYLDLYNEEQKKRHNILPGITGLAQVNGRNNQTWEDRFSFDVEYVENISFVGDLNIIIQTVLKVVKRDGVTGSGSATMEKFSGNC